MNYQPHLPYAADANVTIGRMVEVCVHCQAKKWSTETAGISTEVKNHDETHYET